MYREVTPMYTKDKKKQQWTHIRIRKAVLEKVHEYLNTPEASNLGIGSATQFIDLAIRDLLKDYFKEKRSKPSI